MAGLPNLLEQKAITFVENCRVEFKWRNLSKDVIMDVGCGEAGYCGKEILNMFQVEALIFIDNNRNEIRSFQLANMECVLADIEIMETIQIYAGKMDKVISTYVFHQVGEKEEAFRNVYYLLKPGGEAAVVFINKTSLYEWLEELLKKPKWNEAYKNQFPEIEVRNEFGADYYREMVERIGFRVVECKEEPIVNRYRSDEDCKDSLYEMSRKNFNIPSEAIEEFKEDCFQVFLKVYPRNDEGHLRYSSNEVTVLLTKPKETLKKDRPPNLLERKAIAFVENCRDEFKWRNLSKDVIMDVGCGEAGYCGKAILNMFQVEALIFIDNNRNEIRSFQLANMECVLADIEIMETIQIYAGKMDKVISTYVFHQVIQKEEAFRNVYYLLKPGGEAAVVFINKTLLYKWLEELLKKPKWNEAYKNQFPEIEVQREFRDHYYREMVERIGFRVVECKEENIMNRYSSDEDCKDSLYEMSRKNFNITSEAIEEFKEDCFQVFLKVYPRDDEGNLRYSSNEVTVLLTKPKETLKIEGNIFHEQKVETFVENCRIEFKWRNLSDDVIMDVGCGKAGYCGKEILKLFEDVGALIFIDKDRNEIRNFQLELAVNNKCVLADIERMETLEKYAGEIDKVISTYVFDQLIEKEVAFQNVYNLLKPRGEAAVVFIKKTLLDEWLKELLKKPKWNEAYKNQYPDIEVQSEFGADYYQEMVERIGFRVVECKEENTVIRYSSDEDCKESLYRMSRNKFNIPPVAIEEFKEDSFQALLKVSPRDGAGNPCHGAIEVIVLLTKPAE